MAEEASISTYEKRTGFNVASLDHIFAEGEEEEHWLNPYPKPEDASRENPLPLWVGSVQMELNEKSPTNNVLVDDSMFRFGLGGWDTPIYEKQSKQRDIDSNDGNGPVSKKKAIKNQLAKKDDVRTVMVEEEDDDDNCASNDTRETDNMSQGNKTSQQPVLDPGYNLDMPSLI